MVFPSIQFIFLFLPVVIFLYFIIPNQKWRNSILAISSFFFFAWINPRHIPVLIGSIIVNFLFGLVIDRFIKNDKFSSAKRYLRISIFINILILFSYKYLGFFIENISDIFNISLINTESVLPLGISYFTFSGISYLLDIYYRKETAEKNILLFTVFFTMFPKLIQGPITRYSEVKQELINSQMNGDVIADGIRRFIIGLAKKVIIADYLGIVAEKVFNSTYSQIGVDVAWFGLIAFTLQIFFDFSGYTDMAIGLAKIFGYHLPENFNFPYCSFSVTDFWRRWHMTLSNWFRTYLFTPLEFSRRKEKYFRQQSNILIVFLFTGLWHGASWNFIIWGIYFGIIIAFEASGFGKLLKKISPFFQNLYTLFLVMLGWVLFRIPNIHNWGPFIRALFGGNGLKGNLTLQTLNVLMFSPIIVISIFLVTPVMSKVIGKLSAGTILQKTLLDIIYFAIFLISVSYILSNGFSAFLYERF